MASGVGLCPARHPLQTRRVSGGILGFAKKCCQTCEQKIQIGGIRYSCKACDYHLCETCFGFLHGKQQHFKTASTRNTNQASYIGARGVSSVPAHLSTRPNQQFRDSAASSPGGARYGVKLTGRKRSVLVGINYLHTSAELRGCVNDVHRMMPVLESLGFPRDSGSQRVLIDEPGWPAHMQPTMANMRSALAWLVEGAQAGDMLFFHYSGHGGREPKEDGFHETLCPVDFESAGMLWDTELFSTLVQPLPSGCKLTCLLDSCHSGGALDLPYLFTGTAENMRKALAGEAGQMAMSKNWLQDLELMRAGDTSAILADAASLGLGLWQKWRQYKASKHANGTGFCAEEQQNIGLAVGEVIAITGCASDQTSADVGNVNEQFELRPTNTTSGGRLVLDSRRNTSSDAGGALTSAFVEAIGTLNGPSYLGMLEHIRQKLAEEGFSQVPQLASSLLIDMSQPFSVDSICLPADPSKIAEPNATRTSRSGMTMDTTGAAGGFLTALAAAPLGVQMLQNVGDFPNISEALDPFELLGENVTDGLTGLGEHLREDLWGGGESSDSTRQIGEQAQGPFPTLLGSFGAPSAMEGLFKNFVGGDEGYFEDEDDYDW